MKKQHPSLKNNLPVTLDNPVHSVSLEHWDVIPKKTVPVRTFESIYLHDGYHCNFGEVTL